MTVKEELIQIIDKMPEENISRVIELIKSNEYLDEALEMENKGKLITKTIEELENYISNIDKYSLEYKNKYKKFNDKYNYLDDGNASERVISLVFKK